MADYDDLLVEDPPEQANGFDKEAWKKGKQEEREAVFALIDSTAELVLSDAGALRQYLDTQTRFYKYTTNNALLVMAKDPHATQLGDSEYWKGQGRIVEKGSPYVMILEPNGTYTGKDGRKHTNFQVKHLYDVCRTRPQRFSRRTREEEAKPETAPTQRSLLNALMKAAPVPVIAAELKDKNVGYDAAKQVIQVRPKIPFPLMFRSLAAQCACVGQDKKAHDTPDSLISQCAAYQVCAKYGVPTEDITLQLGEGFNGKEPRELRGLLDEIHEAGAVLCDRMDRALYRERSAEKNREVGR